MDLIENVHIDALTCVIRDIPENYKPEIHSGFDYIISKNLPIPNRDTGEVESRSCGYRRSIKVLIEENETGNERKYITIYIEPYNPKWAFIRFSLFKHPYGRLNYASAKKVLSKLFMFCSSSYLVSSHVFVTRLDIAIDKQVSIRELWFDSPRAQVSILIFNRKGQLESVYLGNNRSDNQARIYDKAAQLKSKRHKHLSEKQLLRVEFSYKPDCCIDMVFDKINLVSKLESFSVYNARAIKNARILCDETWGIAQHVGIKSILQSMDQSSRRKMRTQLKPFRKKLISSTELEKRIETMQLDLLILLDNDVQF